MGVDWRGLNRANWDDRVPVHLASTFYDVAGFRAGASTLRPFESAEAGAVTGKRLVHLQCHIGLDTLSWARHGAQVSGRRFDIVYTGIGALVWLPDITRWARVVAQLLAPGGFLYLVESHPFAQVLDDDSGLVVARDYFDAEPEVEDWSYTYTDGPALEHVRSVQFQHGPGEIVTALVAAGMRVEFMHEFEFDAFGRWESLERRDDGTYRFPAGRPRVPLIFSVRASLPL